jgi:hypothetical protein
MAVRLSALRAGRPLPPGRFLVLISVRGWVEPRAMVRLDGLGRLKNLMASSGICILWHVDPLLGNARNTCNNRQGIKRSVFYVVRAVSIARQRVTRHIPAEANARNRRSTARQRRGKKALSTIQAVFLGSVQSGYKRVEFRSWQYNCGRIETGE